MAPNRYEEVALSEVLDFRNGKGLSPSRYTSSGKHPVFGSNGQIARSDDVLNSDPVVVIGRVGAYCGSVHAVFEPSWVTDNAIIARSRPGGDIRYLYYLLSSLDLRAAATGSAQPLVTQGALGMLRGHHAPPAAQRAIAHILGSLDDKIELNRRMNETLEEMARALFKSWFVDFDPVRAKAAGRRPSGMDAETAKLFPSQFEESELGQIPKGWRILPLDQVAHFQNGLALQRFRPAEGAPALPVIKIAQLRTNRPDSGEWATTDIKPECIIEDGDIVFSWSGSLTVVVWTGGRGALNQHLFKVTSEQFPKWFYLAWTMKHLPQFQSIAADKATTMGHIKRHHLTEALCIIPPAPLLARVRDSFEPLLSRRTASSVEMKVLAELRDALLPKLLSGELSVKNAERILEATA